MSVCPSGSPEQERGRSGPKPASRQPHACPSCGRTFSRSEYARRHWALKHAPQLHPCPHCPTTVSSHSLLVTHFRFSHPALQAPEERRVPSPIPIIDSNASTTTSFASRRGASPVASTSSAGVYAGIGGAERVIEPPALTTLQPLSFALPPENPPPPQPYQPPGRSPSSSSFGTAHAPYTPYDPSTALLLDAAMSAPTCGALHALPTLPTSRPSSAFTHRLRSPSPLALSGPIRFDRAVQTDLSASDLDDLEALPLPPSSANTISAFFDLRGLDQAAMEVDGEEVDQLWDED